MSGKQPRIVLAVTADKSLGLMSGFPEYLVQRGWDVHLVSSPGPALHSFENVAGISTHALPMRRDPALWSDLRSLSAWIQLLRRIRPDIVSVGTPKAGLVGGIAAWLTRVPRRVYLLRGIRLETSHGVQRWILWLAEWLSIHCAQQVLAVSKSLKTLAVELRLAAPQRIVVLGEGSSNGVVVQRFDRSCFSPSDVLAFRSQIGLVPEVPVIGFVGRLTRDKGLAELASACVELSRQGVDYQLLIVGGMDDDSGAGAFQQVREAGRKMIEVGHVEDTAIYYHTMDILCLPTYREGFPNVVLEAGAAGIAAVTTDSTGAIDSVVDGETGLVVRARSSQSLADALARLLKDPEARARMGAAAHARVRRNFDRADVARRAEDFYRAQLGQAGQSAWGSSEARA